MITAMACYRSTTVPWRSSRTLCPPRLRHSERHRRHPAPFSSSPSKSNGESHRLFGPMAFLSWYSLQLDRRPLLIKGISSGLIAASGDFLCQQLSRRGRTRNSIPSRHHPTTELVETTAFSDNAGPVVADVHDPEMAEWELDRSRTLRFFLMGAFWVGPATHYWYTALSTRLVPGPSSLVTTAKRLFLDQFGFAPFFAPSVVGILWLLEGKDSVQTIVHRLGDVTPDLIVSGWKLWIPSMAMNFAFVPLKYQVLVSNMVSLFWNVYLSYVSTTVPIPPDGATVDGPSCNVGAALPKPDQ